MVVSQRPSGQFEWAAQSEKRDFQPGENISVLGNWEWVNQVGSRVEAQRRDEDRFGRKSNEAKYAYGVEFVQGLV